MKYSTKLQEAYYTLTRYQFPPPTPLLVQSILDVMKATNALTIDMAKAHVLDNLLEDWMGSISYISAKVAIQFPPRSIGGSKRKGYCRISKFDYKIRRDIGRVRGRGQGRGRPGDHHYSCDRHDPVNG